MAWLNIRLQMLTNGAWNSASCSSPRPPRRPRPESIIASGRSRCVARAFARITVQPMTDASLPRPLPRPRRPAPARRPAVDVGARGLVGRPAAPDVDPHRQRPLADRPDGHRRHDDRAAGVRLLRLPPALLRVRVPLPRRAGARGDRQVADARHRADPRPPEPRPRPRRLGAAARDVPRRGHPRPPDVDARPRPGAPVRGRPAAGAAARRGRAHRRLGVHDPRAAVHRRVLRRQARRAAVVDRVRSLGRRGAGGAATSTRCSRSARRRRGCRSPTRRSSISPRCS